MTTLYSQVPTVGTKIHINSDKIHFSSPPPCVLLLSVKQTVEKLRSLCIFYSNQVFSTTTILLYAHAPSTSPNIASFDWVLRNISQKVKYERYFCHKTKYNVKAASKPLCSTTRVLFTADLQVNFTDVSRNFPTPLPSTRQRSHYIYSTIASTINKHLSNPFSLVDVTTEFIVFTLARTIFFSTVAPFARILQFSLFFVRIFDLYPTYTTTMSLRTIFHLIGFEISVNTAGRNRILSLQSISHVRLTSVNIGADFSTFGLPHSPTTPLMNLYKPLSSTSTYTSQQCIFLKYIISLIRNDY